ncbi:MAG: flagellar motor switch protein FliN [Halobacteriovoraceae bacterium]|jgi:flagellar motor switch protein FliN|nr:flagellar motor switch protein FliN [Halobacteriovoraceae bacterium]MBT5095357.1 flagellar motor switch protein FliN [Halobacteriovoraceae bacterium]
MESSLEESTAHASGEASEDESLEFQEIKKADLHMLYDVPMTVSVELGRADVTLKDVLQMGGGTVIELDKLAGEPLEILVNKRLVSKGEVVVVNEKFGIRLTDIISPMESEGEAGGPVTGD